MKFTPEGGDITVPDVERARRGQLLIEVKDTGVGIPRRCCRAFSTRSSRADSGRRGQFGGLGLGLAIARAVTEMHGGTIRAASGGPGPGATFTIRLDTTAVPRKSTKAPAAGPATTVPADAARSKVLLVEDHPDTARTLARLLTSSGYKVQTAHSVASALQLADAEPFDVVVSDIGLPDATGYELMRSCATVTASRASP